MSYKIKQTTIKINHEPIAGIIKEAILKNGYDLFVELILDKHNCKIGEKIDIYKEVGNENNMCK